MSTENGDNPNLDDRQKRIESAIREAEWDRQFAADVRRVHTLVLIGLEPIGVELPWCQFDNCPNCGDMLIIHYRVNRFGICPMTVCQCGNCEKQLINETDGGRFVELAKLSDGDIEKLRGAT
jgi:hypothetical protein